MTIRAQRTSIEEILLHSGLLNMPDVDGSVTDHDERYYTESEVIALFVNLSGDTMTGALTIEPSGDTALTVKKDIYLKAGQKLYLDGA